MFFLETKKILTGADGTVCNKLLGYQNALCVSDDTCGTWLYQFATYNPKLGRKLSGSTRCVFLTPTSNPSLVTPTQRTYFRIWPCWPFESQLTYLCMLCEPCFTDAFVQAAALHKNPSSFRNPPVCLISDSAPVVQADWIFCWSHSEKQNK